MVAPGLLALFPILRGNHNIRGGEGPGGVRAFGGRATGGDWNSIRKWVDVETYFFRHEHDSCAAAILRAFLWFNQATMAVIILSPPYSFSALHLSRPDSRLFYSGALQCVLIYHRSGFNSNGQRGDFRST
jgi:hypothetical protein